MNRLALSLALLAVACLAPASAEDPAPAPADAPLAAKVELVVPAGAQAGPDFDVERATKAWVETLTPEQRAKSKAYFEGGFPYGHDQWISSWGTAWAAMALVQAMEAPAIRAAQ